MTTQSSYYFAANSGVPLRVACHSIAEQFGLPGFRFDVHDHWEYGVAEANGVHFNVTKSSDHRTVETWMEDCPENVNYQVILTTEAMSPEVENVLSNILETDVVQYASKSDESASHH